MALTEQQLKNLYQSAVEYHQAGQLREAEMLYEQILDAKPNHAESSHLLGLIAYERGDHNLATQRIEKAIDINTQAPIFHYNLGIVYGSEGKLEEAARSYQEAIRLRPAFPDALNNLGNVFKDQGKLDGAIGMFSRALEIKPDFAEGHSNFLLTLNYHSSLDPKMIFEEHRNWARQHADPLAPVNLFRAIDSNPYRRLRIGYVSPDFCSHSVAFFIEAILAAHHRAAFEVFCYSDASQPDGVTETLKAQADTWRNISKIPNEQVADLVQNDKIDILIDLAGHTGNNRLLVFARKPAPVQVSYLGYPNTTGLSSIDYRITDAWADPFNETDQYWTEELVRLPYGFLCYKPPIDAPEIVKLPALQTGQITFGSFNRLSKVTPEAIALWSRILQAVPDSRLIVKSRALTDLQTRQRVQEMFNGNGVSAERIKLIDYIPYHSEHLALYNKIDIGLDSFPYNGTTTTCEALWMGVPVIALEGKHHASRVGISLLSSIGATDLISETPDAYLHKATCLAGDLDRLQKLRGELRRKMSLSALTDPEHITRSLEKAYRHMWHRWCKDRASAPPAPPAGTLYVSATGSHQRKTLKKKVRKLHIGGHVSHSEWEVLDAVPAPHVDHTGDAKDLSRFGDGTFSEIYASHVLEHFDYVGEVDAVLKEWHRVLRPGGKLYISVPDMDRLAQLFLLKDRLSLHERFHVMRIMFGGHTNIYDYHRVGLNREFLQSFLINAGFINLKIVNDFGIFKDDSTMKYHEVPVSVNIMAEKAPDPFAEQNSCLQLQ
jgi:predicted O-linked N-acetylglucosamine transferase (SPINDLY family)/predicted SAM-dependent methyltransferase